MKTSELTGALLDYWVARAEGIKVTKHDGDQWFWRDNVAYYIGGDFAPQYSPSTDWAQGGPLIEKHADVLCKNGSGWHVRTLLLPITRPDGCPCYGADGDTPLIAICRAVVRAAFGDEVEEVT